MLGWRPRDLEGLEDLARKEGRLRELVMGRAAIDARAEIARDDDEEGDGAALDEALGFSASVFGRATKR